MYLFVMAEMVLWWLALLSVDIFFFHFFQSFFGLSLL